MGKNKEDAKNYNKIHVWIFKNFVKAYKCESENCSGISTNYNWCLKKGKQYEKNADNFFMMCRSCHSKYDMTQYARDSTGARFRGCQVKHRKKVIAYINNCPVFVFPCILEASKILNVLSTSIINNLKGRSKRCSIYNFKYHA